jgi:Fatty acid desaturase
MSRGVLTSARQGFLRHSTWDALLIALAAGHGALLLAVPAAPVIALGVWWNSNTIAHLFIHRPFFRTQTLNALFSLYLSLLLGIPQRLWRERHLAHHADRPCSLCWSWQLCLETVAILGLWAFLLIRVPGLFLMAYLPGLLAGLALCSLHGHLEHAHGTTSHHGTLYNLLFFNDGYHVEHHAHPAEHWTTLPSWTGPEARTSRWPAVLRWLEVFSLDSLERLVLRSRWLQSFVLSRHEQAFRVLLAKLPPVKSVAIVGGGLFPRTLLVLHRLLPDARFVIIDASLDNLESGKGFFPEGVEVVHAWYDREIVRGFDLVVFPLAFRGDRKDLYRDPPAPLVVVHDWLWHRRGTGVIVSLFLLKRLNLVRS